MNLSFLLTFTSLRQLSISIFRISKKGFNYEKTIALSEPLFVFSKVSFSAEPLVLNASLDNPIIFIGGRHAFGAKVKYDIKEEVDFNFYASSVMDDQGNYETGEGRNGAMQINTTFEAPR